MHTGGERKRGSVELAEESVAEMRRLLMEIQAIDTATALRSLRRAFPHAPLADRVRALGTARP